MSFSSEERMEFIVPQNTRRRGFSLLDVLLALGVSAAMYASVAQMQNDLTNNLRAQAAANSMVMLADAANIYIKANYKSLANYGSSFEIPITGNTSWNSIGDLTSTGMLPSSFTNRFPGNQQAHLLVRQIQQNGNVPQHLEAMLITAGGSPMNDRQVGLAMAKMGGSGGGIMKNPPPGVLSTNIQGSFASWTQAIGNWSGTGVTPTYGHIAYDLSTVGSPVGEWLDRYDVGNPEANRMHTNIDFNNFNANNVNTIDGYNNDDIHMGDSEHTGRVVMQNGGMACQGNITDCHFDISDDGGFYDHNDFWVTYQGSYANQGLRISGVGNNLQVYGQTLANDGVVTSDTSGIQWTTDPEVGAGVEAAATYGNGWLNFSGANGFQGISTQIVQGTKFQDINDTDYYMIPSQLSHLNNANFAGKIGVMGYDYQDGLPSGWGGGVQTWDVYAHGTVAVGDGGQIDALMDNQGYIQASQYVQSQILRPSYVATIGQSCSNLSVNGMMGRQIGFTVNDGDIARTSEGYAVSCVNGVWAGDEQPIKFRDYGDISSGRNTTPFPIYIASNFVGGGSDPGIFHGKHWGSEYINVNGTQVCTQVGSRLDRGSCFAIVPSGASWDTGMMSRGWRSHNVVIYGKVLP